MARIFYVHWNKDEGMETVRALRAEGHTVVFHWKTESGAGADAWRSIKNRPPDALVVSLARLPSHGRQVAAVTLETKRLAEVPVVFVGGEAETVAKAREQFPEAKFTTAGRLAGVLGQIG